MKKLFLALAAGALLSIALRYAGVGAPPTSLTIIATAVFAGLVMLTALMLRGIVRLFTAMGRTCDLCGKPRDPKSTAPGAWEYGIRACDGCAAVLHERHKDDPPIPRYHPPE